MDGCDKEGRRWGRSCRRWRGCRWSTCWSERASWLQSWNYTPESASPWAICVWVCAHHHVPAGLRVSTRVPHCMARSRRRQEGADDILVFQTKEVTWLLPGDMVETVGQIAGKQQIHKLLCPQQLPVHLFLCPITSRCWYSENSNHIWTALFICFGSYQTRVSVYAKDD